MKRAGALVVRIGPDEACANDCMAIAALDQPTVITLAEADI